MAVDTPQMKHITLSKNMPRSSSMIIVVQSLWALSESWSETVISEQGSEESCNMVGPLIFCRSLLTKDRKDTADWLTDEEFGVLLAPEGVSDFGGATPKLNRNGRASPDMPIDTQHSTYKTDRDVPPGCTASLTLYGQ